jgi:hypothetical protein
MAGAMLGVSVRHVCGVLIATLVVSGCGSDDIVTNQVVINAVITLVDSGPALRSARTFVLPDTVMLVPRAGTPIGINAAEQIIATIRGQFVALGWTEVPQTRESRPDVVVLVAASTQIRSSLIDPDWFGTWGYLPFWGAGVDPTWVWGLSVSEIPYTYQVGTLIITMLNVRAPNVTRKRIPVLWAAGIDGVVGDPSTATRALVGIAQAFAQSPYLRVK